MEFTNNVKRAFVRPTREQALGLSSYAFEATRNISMRLVNLDESDEGRGSWVVVITRGAETLYLADPDR